MSLSLAFAYPLSFLYPNSTLPMKGPERCPYLVADFSAADIQIGSLAVPVEVIAVWSLVQLI